jgi:hypothetical protein
MLPVAPAATATLGSTAGMADASLAPRVNALSIRPAARVILGKDMFMAKILFG